MSINSKAYKTLSISKFVSPAQSLRDVHRNMMRMRVCVCGDIHMYWVLKKQCQWFSDHNVRLEVE